MGIGLSRLRCFSIQWSRLSKAFKCGTFKSAIDALESLGSEVVSGDEAKQKLAEKLYQLYQGVVEVCLQLDNLAEAIAYVERSQSPNLVELLATRDLYPKGDIPETILNELDRLRHFHERG